MQKQEIIQKIKFIMQDRLNVDNNLIIEENYDESLTGGTFNFKSLDLVYLFLEVEKNFNVQIDATKIVNYEFNTINGIAKLIEG